MKNDLSMTSSFAMGTRDTAASAGRRNASPCTLQRSFASRCPSAHYFHSSARINSGVRKASHHKQIRSVLDAESRAADWSGVSPGQTRLGSEFLSCRRCIGNNVVHRDEAAG